MVTKIRQTNKKGRGVSYLLRADGLHKKGKNPRFNEISSEIL